MLKIQRVTAETRFFLARKERKPTVMIIRVTLNRVLCTKDIKNMLREVRSLTIFCIHSLCLLPNLSASRPIFNIYSWIRYSILLSIVLDWWPVLSTRDVKSLQKHIVTLMSVRLISNSIQYAKNLKHGERSMISRRLLYSFLSSSSCFVFRLVLTIILLSSSSLVYTAFFRHALIHGGWRGCHAICGGQYVIVMYW